MIGASILGIMLLAGPYDPNPTCKIMYQGTAEDWRFVKVYEVATGQIVLQTVIRSGFTRDVYVATPAIRIYSKWAGDIEYKPSPPVQCEKGGTVKF